MRIYLLFTLLILVSCQEEITLDLPQIEQKLVVEGVIESNFPPYVIFSRNQGYFDPINEETYNNIFVNDIDTAKIWYLNENGEKETRLLQQIEGLDSIATIYSVTDYNFLSSAENTYEFSKEGRKYFLEVKWNNQIISAETFIPVSTKLDCVWVEKNENADKDFKCDIRAIYSDPAETQNNILIRSKRIQYFERDSIIGEVIKDKDPRFLLIDAGQDVLINGESFETYFPKPKKDGFPNGTYDSERFKVFIDNGIEDSVLLPHDIVLIKFCQIDQLSLKFWRGVTRQAATNGNPFAEPMNLVSNIVGGLGVFTGYGAFYYQIPIVKDTAIYTEYLPKFTEIF